jgi:hypothetical protein
MEIRIVLTARMKKIVVEHANLDAKNLVNAFLMLGAATEMTTAAMVPMRIIKCVLLFRASQANSGKFF